MADPNGAIDAAAEWCACVALLDELRPGDATQWHLVTRFARRLDPLARQPLASHLFATRHSRTRPLDDPAWRFVVTPKLLHGNDLLGYLVHAYSAHFLLTRDRLATTVHGAAGPIDEQITAVRRLAALIDDLALASDLYDRAETDFRKARPSWVAYPDDLRIVEVALERRSRLLLTRRGEEWFVLLPPVTFDDLAGREGSDDGGTAGVREPRTPPRRFW